MDGYSLLTGTCSGSQTIGGARLFDMDQLLFSIQASFRCEQQKLPTTSSHPPRGFGLAILPKWGTTNVAVVRQAFLINFCTATWTFFVELVGILGHDTSSP